MKWSSSNFSGFAYASVSVLSLMLVSVTAAAERLQNLPPPQTAFSHDARPSANGQSVPTPSVHILPPPHHGPSPLLYVRLSGPAGLRITFYPSPVEAKEYAAATVVGLRPGYVYRIRLTGLPGHPNDALYPTLEVRGTLMMPPGLRAGDFPAQIIFSAEDIEKVLASAYLTKIVALENPDVALPDSTQKDQPMEIEVASSKEAMAEARLRGRPMLILRWGERALGADELARQAIPGTILL